MPKKIWEAWDEIPTVGMIKDWISLNLDTTLILLVIVMIAAFFPGFGA